MWDQACSDQPPDPLTPLMLGCNHYATVGNQLSQPPLQRSQGRRNNVRATSLFSQRAAHLRGLISAPTCTYTRAYWAQWFENSMTINLEDNFHSLKHYIGPTSRVNNLQPHGAPIGENVNPKRDKSTFQRCIYKAILEQQAPDFHRRFAYKLRRWNLPAASPSLNHRCTAIQCTPNWHARCAHQRLHDLGGLVTPRVHAACFGACWNRWCTLRRFQQTGRCRLCQLPHTEDSIEHYVFCVVVRKVGARCLRLDADLHLNLHTFTCTNPVIRTDEILTRCALLVYATYRALNHQRTTSTPLGQQELHNAMSQWITEGARGHAKTCKTLKQMWTNFPQEPLPPIG